MAKQKALLFNGHAPADFLIRLDDLAEGCNQLRMQIDERESVTRLQRAIAAALVDELNSILDEAEDCS